MSEIPEDGGLSDILGLTGDAQTRRLSHYGDFLGACDNVINELNGSCISVKVDFKYFKGISDKRKYSSNNSSLVEIFAFYAKLQTVEGVSRAFSVIEHDNETMCLAEFIFLCRDFEVIPKLVTKEEVRLIWKVVSLKTSLQAGRGGHVKDFDFLAFKDMLLRIAVFAYNKPIMKDFILKEVLTFPSNLELIGYFIKFLHLDDLPWVRNRLNTVGRDTQGSLHFEHDYLHGHDSDRKPPRTADKIQQDMLMRSSLRMNPIPEAAKISTLPFLVNRKTRNRELVGIATKVVHPLIPPSLSATIKENVIATEYRASQMQERLASTAAAAAVRRSSVSKNGDDTNKRSITSKSHDKDKKDDGDLFDHQIDPEALKAFASTRPELTVFEGAQITEEQRRLMKLDFDNPFFKCLEKYSYQSLRRKGPVAESASDGPFIDMGSLPAGAECLVQLHVTNLTSDQLFIDVTCSDFDCADLKVATFPSSVIPGLTKTISIIFNIESGERSVIGTMNVFAASARTGNTFHVGCPAYYRVGPPLPKDVSTECTVRTLSYLMRRHCSVGRNMTVNFESKKWTWNQEDPMIYSGSRTFHRRFPADNTAVQTVKFAFTEKSQSQQQSQSQSVGTRFGRSS